MGADVELSQERAELVKADLHLHEGEARIRKQQSILSELQTKGLEAWEAERLLHLLRQTLVQWQDHRKLILQRIRHLEARLVAEESSSVLSNDRRA